MNDIIDRIQTIAKQAHERLNEKRWEDAEALLKEAIRIALRHSVPCPWPLWALGVARDHQGNPEQAIESIELSLEQDPTFLPSMTSRDIVLRRLCKLVVDESAPGDRREEAYRLLASRGYALLDPTDTDWPSSGNSSLPN